MSSLVKRPELSLPHHLGFFLSSPWESTSASVLRLTIPIQNRLCYYNISKETTFHGGLKVFLFDVFISNCDRLGCHTFYRGLSQHGSSGALTCGMPFQLVADCSTVFCGAYFRRN